MGVLPGQLTLTGELAFGTVTATEYADAMGVSTATARKRFKLWGALLDRGRLVLDGDRLPVEIRRLIAERRASR